MNTYKRKIVSIDDLSSGDIDRLFFRAHQFAKNGIKQNAAYKNCVVATIFFEPSTRTLLSFKLALMRLGINCLDFNPTISSLKKGESLVETLNTLDAMGIDCFIIRHFEPLSAYAEIIDSTLINAGDGAHEHPTQALIDCFTLFEAFKTHDLGQKKILLIGDIAHSRVACSFIKLMSKMKVKIEILCPKKFVSKKYQTIKHYHSYDEIKDDYDAVMSLRVQKERFNKNEDYKDKDYISYYKLTKQRFLKLSKNGYLLHPGPQNIGVEIDGELLLHKRSLIKQQVKNGVIIRAALIDHLLRMKYE